MKMQRVPYLLCLTVFLQLLGSCTPQVDYTDMKQTMVVEGCIENGEAPLVILSQVLPIGVEIKGEDFWNFPIRWARVSITVDGREYILTGRPDHRYLFDYIYTTNELKGEVGKMYRLNVVYEGRNLSAETTIAPPVPFTDIQVERTAYSDTLVQLTGLVADPGQQQNFYLLKVREDEEQDVFRTCMLGVFSDRVSRDSLLRVPVYRSVKISHINGAPHKTMLFSIHQQIDLKLCHVDEGVFRFWDAYMNMIINASNPFYPSFTNLPGNVSGGLGVWYGAGISKIYVNIPDSLSNNP